MKHISLILTQIALSASALLARREDPAPHIIADDVRLCDNLYMVRLQQGYTIEEHFETIGADLSQHTDLFYPMTALNVYHTRLDLYIIHELVRHDPGVVSVMHDYYSENDHMAIDGVLVKGNIKDGVFNKDCMIWSISGEYEEACWHGVVEFLTTLGGIAEGASRDRKRAAEDGIR